VLATETPRYESIKLSDVLRALCTPEDTTRQTLQDFGNALRAQEGNHALVVRALADRFAKDDPPERIVLDGIRNLGEVRWLHRALGERFALFAITASIDERYKRWDDNTRSHTEFYELDRRDQGESEDYGQQVNRCVDYADVLIPNNEHLDSWEIPSKFGGTVRQYAELVEGRGQRYATMDEVLMNVAYGASHGSKCIKRQVGAVVAYGCEPLSSGYNENPAGLQPCIEQFHTCYRDIVRHERFLELAGSGAKCPFCSSAIPQPLPQPWDCPNCRRSLDEAFFPDRAMKWCTALHAEERAIINAGKRDLSDATLYSTTFPCMLCAEKIIHSGIREVVYVEAYPDVHGLVLFKKSGVMTRSFEGVRSRNFERYFAATQPTMEAAGRKFLRDLAGLP
jgi:deoxycytidylate deaminase